MSLHTRFSNESEESGGTGEEEASRATLSKKVSSRSSGHESVGVSSSAKIPTINVTSFHPSRSNKSFIIDELPPCVPVRTRTSNDNLPNPIDLPRKPTKYNPPFRRNFRYFGYPQDLNMETLTPPRVKSWGSIETILPRAEALKRKPAAKNSGFDPNWMGRLLKKNLLLENPGLIPSTDNARADVRLGGNTDKLRLVHPEFTVHTCPSSLYFPITDPGRKAFCKINRFVQDKIDLNVRAYQVQNPTVMKMMYTEQVMMEDEAKRSKSNRSSRHERASQTQEHLLARRRTTLRQSSVPESLTVLEDKLLFDYDAKVVSPVVKTLCMDKGYPGMNRQLYQRPREQEDTSSAMDRSVDDKLVYGGPQIPHFAMNIPEDVWQKLAKVRQRQKESEKNLLQRLRMNDPNFGKFKVFNQLELRDQVMREVRKDFVERLKEDRSTPLPPELFEDNREFFQPPHDFVGRGELPPQGPFWWKEEREPYPSPDELEIVDKFMSDAKDHHNFTHHLPGLLYAPKHPHQPIELDWMEKGAEMSELRDERKTPDHLHEMPAYIMWMGKDTFREKFQKAVKEGAKELVGPEIWEAYKRMYGIQEEPPQKEEEEEKPVEEVKPVRKLVRRVRKVKPKPQPQKLETVEEEEEDGDDEEEGDEEEGDGEEEASEPEDIKLEVKPSPWEEVELEPEYKLSTDLAQDEEFPMPNVSFSDIEFPEDEIPSEMKEYMKTYHQSIISGEPVAKSEEEPKGSDASSSNTSSDTEGDRDAITSLSHDPVSHLQSMYVSSMVKKKSSHKYVKAQELVPPDLKDIFLMDTYTEDIQQLLERNQDIPQFLQLF